MHSTWLLSALGCRLAQVGLMLALTAFATPVSVVSGQQAAAPPAARVFSGDAGLMFNVIKPDKTADFEMVIGKLKEALQKSDKPERKQQGASWRVYKQAEPGPGGSVLYVFVVSPVVKDADYTITKILSEAFPTEVQELYKVYSGAFAGGISMSNLQLVNDLGK